MNKKIVKIILIISGILLLSGFGIYGYKYIKNRNSKKNTNENENELKEVSNLTTAFSGQSAGSYKITGYYNKVDVTSTLGINCKYASSSSCKKYNFYGTIYVNNSVKLKSSWIFYSKEGYSSNYGIASMSEYMNYVSSYSGYILISIGTYVDSSYYGNTYVTNYPYTKIFNANTGDLIFEVPTNSNETISGVSGYNAYSFSKNMILGTFTSGYIYYLKSNYNLSDGNNVEVHKVTFDPSSYSYTDDIVKYTKGTIS